MYEKQIDAAQGTPFQKKVWHELCRIKKGEVMTYTELARRIGKPRAIRAAANAVGVNPFAPQVPCHRVVRSDGKLGGYSAKGGIATKLKLLKQEKVDVTKFR
ncbi:MGMT family protein [bacterium]|nr:MGMT family protein [bacterium]